MSEQAKSRSMEEIQSEYNGLCLRAGHLQYQIAAHEQDLELINQQLRSLNLEASVLVEKQKSSESAEAKVEVASE